MTNSALCKDATFERLTAALAGSKEVKAPGLKKGTMT